jgi:hypothetical protein
LLFHLRLTSNQNPIKVRPQTKPTRRQTSDAFGCGASDLAGKMKQKRHTIQTVAVEKKQKMHPRMTEAQRRGQSARQTGLNKSTGTYRADMALKTFSWDNEE